MDDKDFVLQSMVKVLSDDLRKKKTARVGTQESVKKRAVPTASKRAVPTAGKTVNL